MAHFKYTALSQDGEQVTGLIEAYNEVDAARRVKELYPMVVKLTQSGTQVQNLLAVEVGGPHLDSKAFTLMCSQFAILLSSGVPLARTVALIADRTTEKTLKRLLTEVAKDVEDGRSLSASFAEHGEKLLPPTFVETLRAGEESGNLERSFQSMHEHFDKQAKMGAKVRGALAYPVFVMVVAIGVVIVLMVAVVPTFIEMFAEYGAELPLITRMLIAISNFFRDSIVYIVAVTAAVLLGLKLYGGKAEGKRNLAKLQLKIPILGNIGVLNAASQFANSMAILIDSGLTINKAVSIAGKVIDNYYISEEVGKLSGSLEEGRTLGASMRAAAILPDILVDMVAVGEESGELVHTLKTISLFYDEELEQAVQSALAKMEPMLLVTLGGVAAFIVAAVYLAMFQLYGSM